MAIKIVMTKTYLEWIPREMKRILKSVQKPVIHKSLYLLPS